MDKIDILKHSETKWRTRSNDKISEVISHFASVQSNSVALEGSCQSMVYRSMRCLVPAVYNCLIGLSKTVKLSPYCEYIKMVNIFFFDFVFSSQMAL